MSKFDKNEANISNLFNKLLKNYINSIIVAQLKRECVLFALSESERELTLVLTEKHSCYSSAVI